MCLTEKKKNQYMKRFTYRDGQKKANFDNAVILLHKYLWGDMLGFFVTLFDKFFYKNYGARTCPWGPSPEFNVIYRTFQKGPKSRG